MHYTVTTHNNTHLDVTNEYQEMLGTLEYTFWQPKRAHITLTDNTVYDIDPTGFWLNTMEVTKNGEEYAVIKYNWPGSHLVVSSQTTFPSPSEEKIY
ncbi:MAG TPA: hypothetical protein VN721_04315 [Flavipsychrobacter sp.]|nr:hypothetical protein [Flavipsychrobacter sp.]